MIYVYADDEQFRAALHAVLLENVADAIARATETRSDSRKLRGESQRTRSRVRQSRRASGQLCRHALLTATSATMQGASRSPCGQ